MPNIFDDPEVQAATAAAGVTRPGHAGIRDITSAPSHPRSTSRPTSKRGKHVSGHPGRRAAAQSDRSLTREFDRWLRQQPEIAAPSPGEESGLFGELLKLARGQQMDLRTPGGVLKLVDLLLDLDAPEEDGSIAASLATLHDYVHFRMDTVTDPAGWEEIHQAVDDAASEALDDPLPGADILHMAMNDADQIDPEERRAAFAKTRLVAAATELLTWIGSGRKVAPSGGLRRVDIAHGAGLLGIDAIGVNKLPPYVPDAQPLIELEDAEPQSATLHVLSMLDVPMLPSWWGALASAQLIEVGSYRVTPGAAAQGWTADRLPPLDAAEMVIGMTVAQYLCEDLDRRSAFLADRVTAITIARLVQALDPDHGEPPYAENAWDELLTWRVQRDLQRLERVGVLTPNAEGDLIVPTALRGAVARGVITAWAILTTEFETG